MGSAAAGKFQDHYKLLGVDPKATLDVIQLAYNSLKATATSPEQIAELDLALEVLSDPMSRKMFDSVRGGEDDREFIFSGLDFFNSMVHDRDRRMTMLCVLYDVRRQNPRVPMLTLRQFEKVVNMTEEQIQMALWYVKTLGLVSVDDKSKMQITAQGMDFLQNNTPDPASIWPHLKNPAGPAPAGVATTDLAHLATALEPAGQPVPATPVPTPVAATPATPAQQEPPKPRMISMLRRTQISITEA
jgi:hypothetical protein